MFHFSFLENFSLDRSLETFGVWWRRWSATVFSILFFSVLGLGIFSWYQSVYMFHWSADDEREYRLSKDKQVKFQREKFDAVLRGLDDRAKGYQKVSRPVRNIFFGE